MVEIDPKVMERVLYVLLKTKKIIAAEILTMPLPRVPEGAMVLGEMTDWECRVFLYGKRLYDQGQEDSEEMAAIAFLSMEGLLKRLQNEHPMLDISPGKVHICAEGVIIYDPAAPLMHMMSDILHRIMGNM